MLQRTHIQLLKHVIQILALCRFKFTSTLTQRPLVSTPQWQSQHNRALQNVREPIIDDDMKMFMKRHKMLCNIYKAIIRSNGNECSFKSENVLQCHFFYSA